MCQQYFVDNPTVRDQLYCNTKSMSKLAGATDTEEMSVLRTVLGQEVANTLRKAIFQGQFRPGQRLSETVLAERLKVSRAPLREAFWKLLEEGLITKLPHRGAIVTVLTPENVIEIYDVRIPLESTAVRLAAASRDRPAAITAVRGAFAEMLEIAEKGDFVAYLAADYAFHQTIWRASGNGRLQRILKQICTPYFAFSTIESVGHEKQFPTAAAAQHHSLLVDAISTATPEEAEQIAREVIQENKEVFLRRCFEGVPNLVEKASGTLAHGPGKIHFRGPHRNGEESGLNS